jgi:hypothetical protein
MSDPSDRHAVDEISFRTGAYVVRAVATQMQIAWCLAHYYGHVTTLGARLIQPQKAQQAAATSPAPAATTPTTMAGVAPPAPATAPAATQPRTKGLTGKVDAARHRAIAPGAGPINPARPRGSALDGAALDGKAVDHKVTETMAAVALPPPATPSPDEPPAAAAAAAKRATTEPDDDDEPDVEVTSEDIQVLEADEPPDDDSSVSGELRQPVRRAASIKPPMPDPHLADDEDDEPMISIEETAADAKAPRMVPVRRRVKSDPPELKARAGEVSLDERPDRHVDDQPAIIIDDDALVPVGPMSGELRAVTHRDPPPPASSIEVDVDDTNVSVALGDVPPEAAGDEPADAPQAAPRPALPYVREDVPQHVDASSEFSEPVLLERRRTADLPLTTLRAPSNEDGLDTTDDEVVVLEDRKKSPSGRSLKQTQVGVGAIAALTSNQRGGTEPPSAAASVDVTAKDIAALPRLFSRGDSDDEPTGVDGPSLPPDEDRTDQTLAAPSRGPEDDTNPRILAVPVAPVIVRPRRSSSMRPQSSPQPAPQPPRCRARSRSKTSRWGRTRSRSVRRPA